MGALTILYQFDPTEALLGSPSDATQFYQFGFAAFCNIYRIEPTQLALGFTDFHEHNPIFVFRDFAGQTGSGERLRLPRVDGHAGVMISFVDT